MTPEKFIALWKGNPLTERAGAQTHFTDLCDVLGVDKPRDPDNYCFERGAKKKAGPDGSAGDGWADFCANSPVPPASMTAALCVWSHQTREQFCANAVTGMVR